MTKPRPCVDCGSTEPRKRRNPYWCDPCDVKRCARITGSLNAISADMVTRHHEEKAGDG